MNDGYAVYAPTLLQRFLRWVFPARYLEPKFDVEPGFVPGELWTTLVIDLDWKDRLRVLVTGRARVDIRTATDKIVDKVKTRSTFYVMHPGER